MPIVKNHTVLDLFCGCGGLSLGFIQAGYDVLLGVDVWKDALVTYQRNHKDSKTLQADLINLQGDDIVRVIGTDKVDVIIGGPPCQGFSVAGKRIIDDERNQLYKSFVKMVEYFKPKAFVMENVPNILSMGGGIVKESILNDFAKLGYNVSTKVLLASEYGVPQNRRRAFFVGLKDGMFDFNMPKYGHLVTTREAISDLTEDSIEDGELYPNPAESQYQEMMRLGSQYVYNHKITCHNERTKEIIALVPDGGNYKDLPKELQGTRNVHIAWTRFNSSRPCVTIDTGHRHHFHYKYNRVPTVRESARIQAFPDNFIFYGSTTSQLKQVGNAVPSILARVIAEHLKSYYL